MQVFRTTSSLGALSDPAIRVYNRASRQPSWVIRAAIGAGLLVLLAILAIILVPVIAAIVLVFLAGTALSRVRRLFAQLLTGAHDTLIIVDDESGDTMGSHGRRNVRVVERR